MRKKDFSHLSQIHGLNFRAPLQLRWLSNPELCEGYQGSQLNGKAQSKDWGFFIYRDSGDGLIGESYSDVGI